MAWLTRCPRCGSDDVYVDKTTIRVGWWVLAYDCDNCGLSEHATERDKIAKLRDRWNDIRSDDEDVIARVPKISLGSLLAAGWLTGVPLPARTNAEKHLYMDLHPCACGEKRFEPKISLLDRGGPLVSVYEGRCKGCGEIRRFEFKLPDKIVPPGKGVVYGSSQASMIIDPGQFLALADSNAKVAPMSVAGLDDAERMRAQRRMAIAIAAIEEVIKFIPPNEDRVPANAFYTEFGGTVYDAEPGRFRKLRLEAVLQAYRDVAQSYRKSRQSDPPEVVKQKARHAIGRVKSDKSKLRIGDTSPIRDPDTSLVATFEEFEGNLHRYFQADTMLPTEIPRLFDYWLVFAADQARVRGHERMFRPENANPVFGLAWWEERQRGNSRLNYPITALDHMNMLLSIDPRAGNRPKPRPYCPDNIVGSWRRIGMSKDGKTVEEPPEERTWQLHGDGRLDAHEDSERIGFNWRVHLARIPELWLRPPQGPRVLRFAARQKGDVMDLRAFADTHGFSRWRRQPPQ
jgi:hypothetical protein